MDRHDILDKSWFIHLEVVVKDCIINKHMSTSGDIRQLESEYGVREVGKKKKWEKIKKRKKARGISEAGL